MINILLGVFIKQLLTASSAMVKTTTPSVIPGPFHFPSAAPSLGKIERSWDHLCALGK